MLLLVGSAHSEVQFQVQVQALPTFTSVRIKWVERGRVQLETAWKRRALAG